PKSSELVADHQRFGSKDAANKHFEKGMSQVFANIHSMADRTYPVTVYYAFKQTDESEIEDDEASATQLVSSTGWETILAGLVETGFTLRGTWPIRTERASRTRGINSNALASSIVLVCRPRPEDAPTISRRGFVD